MKIAVFYAHLLEAAAQKNLPLAEVMQLVRAMGFSGLECDDKDIAENPTAFRALLDATGLEVSSIYHFFDFAKEIDPQALVAFIDRCVSLGSPKILAIPGFFTPNCDRIATLQKLVEGTTLLCTFAAQKGITVTLEDFDSDLAPFHTPEELTYFMQQIPALRYTFDTGNFFYAGVDLLAAFDTLKEHMVHVHLKDRALIRPLAGGEERPTLTGIPMYPTPVGQGVLPLGDAIDQVLSTGYDGYFTCEHFGASDQLLYMEQSARWVKHKLGL